MNSRLRGEAEARIRDGSVKGICFYPNRVASARNYNGMWDRVQVCIPEGLRNKSETETA